MNQIPDRTKRAGVVGDLLAELVLVAVCVAFSEKADADVARVVIAIVHFSLAPSCCSDDGPSPDTFWTLAWSALGDICDGPTSESALLSVSHPVPVGARCCVV